MSRGLDLIGGPKTGAPAGHARLTRKEDPTQGAGQVGSWVGRGLKVWLKASLEGLRSLVLLLPVWIILRAIFLPDFPVATLKESWGPLVDPATWRVLARVFGPLAVLTGTILLAGEWLLGRRRAKRWERRLMKLSGVEEPWKWIREGLYENLNVITLDTWASVRRRTWFGVLLSVGAATAFVTALMLNLPLIDSEAVLLWSYGVFYGYFAFWCIHRSYCMGLHLELSRLAALHGWHHSVEWTQGQDARDAFLVYEGTLRRRFWYGYITAIPSMMTWLPVFVAFFGIYRRTLWSSARYYVLRGYLTPFTDYKQRHSLGSVQAVLGIVLILLGLMLASLG